MANTLLKAETIAATMLGILQREIVLPRLISARPISDFRGAKDDTVTVKVPAVLTARDYQWRTRTADIVVDDLVETSVPIVLDKHPYSAIQITDEELTLDIANFGQQVLQPQVRAVAEKMEDYVAAEMAAAPITNSVDFTVGTDEPYEIAVDLRKALNDANVPRSGRVLLLGSAFEAAFLKSDRVSKVNESGTDSALREAVTGNIAGFTLAFSNAIPEDAGYAYHQTAFVYSMGAPAVPDGVSMGTTQTYEGLSMRWIKDYEAARLRDRSVVSSFMGVASVNDGPDTPDGQDPEGAGNTDPENVRAVKLVAA